MRKTLLAAAAILLPSVAMAEDCERAFATAEGVRLDIRGQYLDIQQRGYATPLPANAMQNAISSYDRFCRRGETIRVPRSLTPIWSEQCDMNKAVIPSGGEIVCVKR